MAKASIQCAKCERRMEFGGMSRSLTGGVSQHDAVATIATMTGWRTVNDEWRCPEHGA